MLCASLLAWLFARSLLLPSEQATLRLTPSGDFPVSSSVAGLVETTVAPITSDRFDASGMGTGMAARFGAYDASWTHTTYRLGDLEITNPLRPGTPLVLPDAAGLENVSVTPAPSLAELSATGPRLELEPLRPGSSRSIVLQAIFSPEKEEAASGTPPAISTLQSLGDVSFAVSGPIADHNRAGGAMAIHLMRSPRFERNQPLDQTASLGSFTGNLVLRPRPHDEVRLLGVYQRAHHPNPAWIPLESSAQARDVLALFHVAAERRDPDHLAWRVAAGVQHAFLDPAGTTVTPTIDSVNDGAILPILIQPAGSTTTVRLAADLKRARLSTSRHDWRLGVTFERDAMHPELLAARNALEFVNHEAARIWQFDPDPSTKPLWHETTTALFAGDRLMLGDAASLEGSVRLEALSASNNGTASIGWTDIYPRLLFKATVSKNAGLGVFVDASRGGLPLPPLALAFGDPASPTGRVYQWTDANHDGVAQPAERGALIARIGPGAGPAGSAALSQFDARLDRPAMVQTIIGMSVDRSRWSVVLSAIVRRTSDLIQVANPGADYTLIKMPDPGLDYPGPVTTVVDTYSRTPASFGLDHYVLTNPSGLDSGSEALEATVQLRSPRVVLAFSGTAMQARATSAVRGFRADENDPGVLDLSANPNALVNALGEPFFDRSYMGKVAMGIRLPHDFRIGAIVRYQDGQPFARLAVVRGLTQGPEPVRPYVNGLTRFTFVGTVDVRVQKEFRGRGRLAMFVDVFNLLNTGREVEEIVATGPNFRATSAVEPPFSLRLGLRIRP